MDDLARQLTTLQRHTSGGKLPNADLQPVQGVFDGLETQFDKVSTIRAEVVTLDVPNDFKLRTDRQRLIVYCNAVKAWSLYGDVDGASLDTFNALAQRKKQMTDRLEVDGIATDCRAIPTTQGFDDKQLRRRRVRRRSSPRRKNLLGCSVRRSKAVSM